MDTVGEMPAVLLVGARSKQWRPLSNEFRGSVHKTVLRLVETVLNNLKQSQVLIDLAGPRLALASPVLGPSRQVHGVLMWIGDPDETPPAEPRARAWEWDLTDRVSPSAVTDPRNPRVPSETLTDRLSRVARPADVARIATDVRVADVGFRSTGEWIDVHGAVHRYTHRCIATFDGPRILGVSVQLPDLLGEDDPDMVAYRVANLSAQAGRVAPALIDAVSGRVIAWLTAARPDLPTTVLSGAAHGFRPLVTKPWPMAPELLLAVYPTS
ncbi:GAF domain-containing protein [Gordonia humi]|uniref:GAF domain-containing protein n=1 Tax=Gordonia humi TaxID=686429 RepID=UPI0031EDCF1D